MAVSDRIAVMKLGVIQQIGRPKELYHRPANLFVATFIGHTNVLKGTLSKQTAKFANGYAITSENFAEDYEGEIQISVRPEEFILLEAGAAQEGIKGVVKSSTFLGLNTQLVVTLETGENVEIIRESSYKEEIVPGSEILLTVKADKVNIFKNDEEAASLMRKESGGAPQ